MKSNADKLAPAAKNWKGGAGTFFNRGSNGGWKDDLTAIEVKNYDLLAENKLGKSCADWIKSGERQVSL